MQLFTSPLFHELLRETGSFLAFMACIIAGCVAVYGVYWAYKRLINWLHPAISYPIGLGLFIVGVSWIILSYQKLDLVADAYNQLMLGVLAVIISLVTMANWDHSWEPIGPCASMITTKRPHYPPPSPPLPRHLKPQYPGLGARKK